jgi:hypothetical protein
VAIGFALSSERCISPLADPMSSMAPLMGARRAAESDDPSGEKPSM